jgi:hypothetical protein
MIQRANERACADRERGSLLLERFHDVARCKHLLEQRIDDDEKEHERRTGRDGEAEFFHAVKIDTAFPERETDEPDQREVGKPEKKTGAGCSERRLDREIASRPAAFTMGYAKQIAFTRRNSPRGDRCRILSIIAREY